MNIRKTLDMREKEGVALKEFLLASGCQVLCVGSDGDHHGWSVCHS